MKLNRLGLALMAIPLSATLGCSMNKSEGDPMAKPARPAELDRLNDWVGTWKNSGTMKMAGSDETMTMNGTNTVQWDIGQRYISERMSATDNKGNKFEGVGLWTYDPKIKKYRIWWFDDYGGASAGTATYNEGTRTWTFKGKNRNMPMGVTTTSVGKATWTDNRSMTWSHTEKAMMGMMKVMEANGTSTKQ